MRPKQEEAKQKPDALVREPLWAGILLNPAASSRRPSALSIKQLAIDGKVLARDCGVAPGPKMGQLLQELLQHVLKHPEDNQAEALKVLAIKFGAGHKRVTSTTKTDSEPEISAINDLENCPRQ